MRALGACLLALAVAVAVSAGLAMGGAAKAASAGPAESLADLRAEAVKAYQAKDYAGFLALERRALALAPGNPRLLYNAACGEALLGHAAEAVRLLDQLLDRQLDLGAETDEDFAAIRQAPEWAAFTRRLAQLRQPRVRSTVAFELADPLLLAAGLAVDPRNGDVYLASVRERKILRRTPAGVVSDFIREAQDGFLAGASLAVDPARRLLFASTSAVPFMAGFRQEDAGRSGVFVFDLRTGRLAGKALLAPDAKLHFLNALAVDRDGNAYVADSGTAGIYRLRRGAATLEAVAPAGAFAATQGLALSADERTLYVADYTDGLWALDLATRERRRLPEPEGAYLAGLDGLSPVSGGLLAVQIGVRPERVLRLTLDAAGGRIAKVETLEMNHPAYAGPVQGAVTGSSILYVANSQLALADPKTGTVAADRARPTVVLRLPL